MSTSDDFKAFLDNIRVDNSDTISLRYGEVTAALNKQYRDTESKTANSLQVGGLWTVDCHQGRIGSGHDLHYASWEVGRL